MGVNELIEALASGRNPRSDDVPAVFNAVAKYKRQMNEIQARALIKVVTLWFKVSCSDAGYDERRVRALTTKFRDAGRRSAPWKPASSKVPGRPQDGSDGNRISRWLLPSDHKFYASEVDATLVEVKYFLQSMAMQGAPKPSIIDVSSLFEGWLVLHPVKAGEYKDPVMLDAIDFEQVIQDPKLIQSGHLTPLDRGGRHDPDNTFLMLYRSNQLQGNLKLNELLDLMRVIVQRHDQLRLSNDKLESIINQQ